MSNNSADASGMIISGAELASTVLPMARKAGYDTDAVGELLARAARTIDALYDHNLRSTDERNALAREGEDLRYTIDGLRRQLAEALSDDKDAKMAEMSAHYEQMRVAHDDMLTHYEEIKDRCVQLETELADARNKLAYDDPENRRNRELTETSRILLAADKTAEALISEARDKAASIIERAEAQQRQVQIDLEEATRSAQERRAEIARTVAEAEETAAERIGEVETIVAEAFSVAEAKRAEIDSEIAAYRESAVIVRADLEAQLETFRVHAGNERDRAAGLLSDLAESIRNFDPAAHVLQGAGTDALDGPTLSGARLELRDDSLVWSDQAAADTHADPIVLGEAEETAVLETWSGDYAGESADLTDTTDIAGQTASAYDFDVTDDAVGQTEAEALTVELETEAIDSDAEDLSTWSAPRGPAIDVDIDLSELPPPPLD